MQPVSCHPSGAKKSQVAVTSLEHLCIPGLHSHALNHRWSSENSIFQNEVTGSNYVGYNKMTNS